ncbi:MAG: glycosyltransferase family 4 protein [Candidatus Pacebacteria bacterium]|nr:glycosyltransferase family 4 protein [Candidatus Paceibacterota bacterium]
MKVLLITIDYLPSLGGVATYYAKLKKHWPSSESLDVLDNSHRELSAETGFLPWLKAFSSVYKATKKENYDYLLAGQILPIGTVCWLLSYILKKPYAVVIHGMDFKFALLKTRKKWLAKRILNKADKVICGNIYTADLVKDFLLQSSKENKKNKIINKVKVVNPGIEPEEALRYLGNKQAIDNLKTQYDLVDKTVLFSLGRLVARKGFDKVLQALSKEKVDFKDLVYVIAGQGEDKDRLENIAKEVKLPVIFLENLSNLDKWLWLNLCDIFIMPAREIKGDFEGFGIVYLEANLASKPVIAGNSGGVKDAVVDGVNGLMVDPENIEAIARAIVKLQNDNHLRLELGKQGKKRAEEKFNWQHQAKLFLDYLKE